MTVRPVKRAVRAVGVRAARDSEWVQMDFRVGAGVRRTTNTR